MKNILLLFIIVFCASCKTEKREVLETYSNGDPKREYIYPDEKNKRHYFIIDYYVGKKVKFEGEVENNKFIGQKKNYYENGIVKEIDSISKPCALNYCCCDGKVTKYFSNGKLKITFYNKNGVGNGPITFYSDDSSEYKLSVYEYRDDVKNGRFEHYYKNGKIYQTGTYKNDTMVGKTTYFEENGDTLKIYNTWKGKEDFPAKKWLEDGQVFYANYIDTTFDVAIYRWEDKKGKELKRETITHKKVGKWVTKEHKWITPN